MSHYLRLKPQQPVSPIQNIKTVWRGATLVRVACIIISVLKLSTVIISGTITILLSQILLLDNLTIPTEIWILVINNRVNNLTPRITKPAPHLSLITRPSKDDNWRLSLPTDRRNATGGPGHPIAVFGRGASDDKKRIMSNPLKI